MFGRNLSIHVGSMVSMPFSPQPRRSTVCLGLSSAAREASTTSSTSMAIMAEPKTMPKRVGSYLPRSRPASFMANLAAIRPSWMVRAISFRLLPIAFSNSFLLSRSLRAEKSRTSPAMRLSRCEGSKAEMRATPLHELRSASQMVFASFPIGVSAPHPVMTVRRGFDMALLMLSRKRLHRFADRLQHIFQLAAEDEIAISEHLLRARLIQVRKGDLGLANQFILNQHPTSDCRPFRA